MKILDRYILITYLRTFFSVFIIFMFIFILQGVWLYISELAGKELDISITAKFIFFYIPKLIPLVVPLTVLLASIMVFGNFAENYEFAAMKSTGISLNRAMRSLSIFIIALGIGCFFFANYVIPWGEFEFYNLRRNIAKVKPALAIAEGQFTEIGDINIKVDKKTGENGKFLEGVIIHKKTNVRTGNYIVINASKGELISSETSNVLQLKLIDGNYYEEIINKDSRKNEKNPHAKSYFESYIINVDLEILNTEDLGDKNYSDRYSMLDVNQLSYTIDSLKAQKQNDYANLRDNLFKRINTNLSQKIDSTKTVEKDSLYNGEILDIFDNRKKIQLLNLVVNASKSSSQIITSNTKSIFNNTVNINKHVNALHNKFVLAFACVILFFVGAPLGALIKKGGLGLPMVIAIVLFLTYHFFGIFAKNSAEKGTFSPIIGAWLSTAVILPLSIYLTTRANNDKGVFQFGDLFVPLKQLFSSKQKQQLSESDTKTFNQYNKLDTKALVAIIKEESDTNINKKPKEIALHSLFHRKISLKELQDEGLTVSSDLIHAKLVLQRYSKMAKLSLIFFCVGVLLVLFYFIFNNNKLPEMSKIALLLSSFSFLIFAIGFCLSQVSKYKFYKLITQNTKRINVFTLILSIPFYPLTYMLLKQQLDQDLHQSCLKTIH